MIQKAWRMDIYNESELTSEIALTVNSANLSADRTDGGIVAMKNSKLSIYYVLSSAVFACIIACNHGTKTRRIQSRQ
jgi:hypothetical protein